MAKTLTVAPREADRRQCVGPVTDWTDEVKNLRWIEDLEARGTSRGLYVAAMGHGVACFDVLLTL